MPQKEGDICYRKKETDVKWRRRHMLQGEGDECYREETDVTGRRRRTLHGEGDGCYREKETDVTGRRRRMLQGEGDGCYTSSILVQGEVEPAQREADGSVKPIY